MLLPSLIVLDEAISASEGSLDPLGLYSVADALGVLLAPGVRERQRHPRFLTAVCASAVVCSDFGPDIVAADDISEPWQIFEWYIVEGLVRRIRPGDRLRGLPGRDKVTSTVNGQLPVSRSR
jgi:hypothetical protein